MRGAHGFILTVNTANPAARASLAFVHFVFHDDNMLGSGFGFGAGDGPADPLVAGEGRDALPHGQHGFISQDGFFHVGGQRVFGAAGEGLSYHRRIVAQL